MLEAPFVFVDIDSQRDFLDPAGALYVPGSQAILPRLASLTRHARVNAIPVLATACAHSPDDEELTQFPPHCMVGTPGQHRVDATAWKGSVVVAPDEAFDGRLTAHLTLEKRALDIFSRRDAGQVVARYNEGRPWFVVYGVATEYCVRCAVLGLLQRGCRVAVVVDGIRAIDAARETEVLAEFVQRGTVLTIEERVRRPGRVIEDALMPDVN
jgi:nicotinamidase/pyrazinamidase